jgi:phosphatidylglycerol---prolipoprotein diacylglyceryl transferase
VYIRKVVATSLCRICFSSTGRGTLRHPPPPSAKSVRIKSCTAERLTERVRGRRFACKMFATSLAEFPVYLHVGPWRLHPHVVFEALAYAVAFRVYLWIRKRNGDVLPGVNRWSVIAAAAMGAVAGSRMLYWFEDPRVTLANWSNPSFLFGGKTIVGALIGGLFAVEFVKRQLGITQRTGDLFAISLCVGIAIGRIGCFLTGLEDHTSGTPTSLPWGVNFGDGIARHPTQLYEIFFAVALGVFLWRCMNSPHVEGDIFKRFMVAYFAFRLACDFLKPDVAVFLGLSSIQWSCVMMLCYYTPDMVRWGRRDAALTPSPDTPIEIPSNVETGR